MCWHETLWEESLLPYIALVISVDKLKVIFETWEFLSSTLKIQIQNNCFILFIPFHEQNVIIKIVFEFLSSVFCLNETTQNFITSAVSITNSLSFFVHYHSLRKGAYIFLPSFQQLFLCLGFCSWINCTPCSAFACGGTIQ